MKCLRKSFKWCSTCTLQKTATVCHQLLFVEAVEIVVYTRLLENRFIVLPMTSVTRFGKNLKVFGQLFYGKFSIWQTFVPTLTFLCNWTICHFWKSQRLKNDMAIWSHCQWQIRSKKKLFCAETFENDFPEKICTARKSRQEEFKEVLNPFQ